MSEAASRHPGGERRRHERLEVKGRLVLHILSPRARPASFVNMSSGGIAIATPEQLTIGTSYRVLITSRQTPPTVFTARVAHIQPHQPGRTPPVFLVGLAFVDLDHDGRASVRRFLNELTRRVGPDGALLPDEPRTGGRTWSAGKEPPGEA